MHYKIVYDPYWVSNGCDCCEDTEMPAYELVLVGSWGATFPEPFHSIEDALLCLLEHNGVTVEVDCETAS